MAESQNANSSIRTLDARTNPVMLRSGQVTSARYRGPRLSVLFIGLIEALLADITAIKRRILLIDPFGTPPILANTSSKGAGVYGTNDQDTRYDPYVDTLVNMGPEVSQLNVIQIQYLRSQLSFKLSTLK